MSLAADGNTLAVGAPYTDLGTALRRAGAVSVYKFHNHTWNQLGKTLFGTDTDHQFGWSISLSKHGNVLAIGERFANHNGFWSGSAKVYTYSPNTQTWIQIGQTLHGEAEKDRFGYSLQINARANVLAVASPWGRLNDGYIKVFTLKNNYWHPLGDTILAHIGNGDWLGYSISLSPYNLRIAAGLPQYGMTGNVKLFHFLNRTWTEIANFNGADWEDDLGKSVSLSASGDTLALGSVAYNQTAHFGYVAVYHLQQYLN